MKLCVALDMATKKQNLNLAKKLKEYDIWLKIGFRSYIRDTNIILQELKNINENFKIFLDLKLHDIPNTMADAACEIASLGVDMFNVHASSGKVAMQTVMQRLKQIKNPPLVLAVTALTSFDQKGFYEIYHEDIQTKAIKFAKDSYESGLDGVVCSAYESKAIKENTDKNFITLSPGIRPFGEDKDDQKRVATIDLAKKELVDFIVVGRAIYNSNEPQKVVQKIIESL